LTAAVEILTVSTAAYSQLLNPYIRWFYSTVPRRNEVQREQTNTDDFTCHRTL